MAKLRVVSLLHIKRQVQTTLQLSSKADQLPILTSDDKP